MASVGFRWLDILEKEFDKSFVDLDVVIGELEADEPDVVFSVRQKLCTLSSCFAQLTHKAQTIFQNSAKIEAELIHMRAELVDSKSKRELLEQELHNLLLQLHSSQLSQQQQNIPKSDVTNSKNIKKKLEAELKSSPVRSSIIHNGNNGNGRYDHNNEELKFSPLALEITRGRNESTQLQLENERLRNTIIGLNSEVYGAKLAAKYLDKELAGRIQQLQLLGREMRGDIRDKLWRQLESEILLQRHKTVVRACRRNNSADGQSHLLLSPSKNSCSKSKTPKHNINEERTEHFGDIRTVVVKRKANQGLGISITGGREHGVPILISELESEGPAALSEALYIGDAILSVNGRDLRQACHKEAVDILQQQTGDCSFEVQYIAADDSDTSLDEDGYNFRFFDKGDFDEENNAKLCSKIAGNLDLIVNTPTAPRTPESESCSAASRRLASSSSTTDSPKKIVPQQISNLMFQNQKNDDETAGKTVQTINISKSLTAELISFDEKAKTEDNLNGNLTTEQDVVVLFDNTTRSTIKLGDFKPNFIDEDEQNLITNSTHDSNYYRKNNLSSNSLNSENFSSPMQTSTDIFLDSELLSSTDVASNVDSQSPKSVAQSDSNDTKLIAKTETIEKIYASNDSLLSENESDISSPILHKNTYSKRNLNRNGGKKKKYFASGVKTLQNIFTSSKYDEYSDISTTDASEFAENDDFLSRSRNDGVKKRSPDHNNITPYTETTPQFEENIHTIISDIFMKNFTPPIPLLKTQTREERIVPQAPHFTHPKKYFSLHGQNLRVGKALRLCPNEDYVQDQVDLMSEKERKDKLLARYVYNNANSFGGDGVGDPDFGTPV